MKLLQNINRRFLIASVSILLVTGGALLVLLNYVLVEEAEEKLENSFEQIRRNLSNGINMSSYFPFYEIDTVEHQTDHQFFSELMLQSKTEEHGELFKQLSAITNINGKCYSIVVRESTMETDDLYEVVAPILIISIFLMVLVLYLINRRISKTVWKEFYRNMDKVKKFSLSKLEGIQLTETGIHEFDELNQVLYNLSSTVIRDYKNLKQFTEDASHEIQTPLSVIRTKLESLIDTDELTPGNIEKIKVIYEATNRLSRLNKDLLLLTKLENQQFETNEIISIESLINDKVNEWEEMIRLNGLSVNRKFENSLEVGMPTTLAEILISNLLSNAINHNQPNGRINLIIYGKNLTISNTGKEAIKHPESIFNRFYKEQQAKNSLGLGLAIVSKICNNYGIKVDYTFEQSLHIFSLQFLL